MSTEIGTGQSLPFILYRLRLVGHSLALISVGTVLYELKAHPALLIALVIFCLGYPHVAYWYASRADKPRPREFTSFCVGAVFWGFWIAAMQFNLLPSVMLVCGLHTEGAGGWRLYFKGLASLCGGILTGVLLLGFHWQPVSSFNVMLASVPALLIFPLMLGITNYNLSRRLVRQHRKALQDSRTDGLSGLMNRDYFDIRAELEFHRCQRGGHSSSFVMIDIDHFKQINDTHGHLAGDKIIQKMATLFLEAIRDIDFAARYGGEEFCLCLVDTSACQASIVAERIRAKVAEMEDEFTDNNLSISCGIAEFHPYYRNYHQWLHKADKALYRAKKLGRNRVEVGEPPAVLKKVAESAVG